MAISELGRELQAVANLQLATNKPLSGPMQVFEDNKGVISMCISDVYTNRSKHVDLRHHYIRELVENGVLEVEHISGIEQPADLLTKGLPNECFAAHRWKMGMRSKGELNEGSIALLTNSEEEHGGNEPIPRGSTVETEDKS